MSSQIDYEPLGWGPHSLGFADEADDFFAMRSRSPCVARASMAPQRFIVSESRMSPGSLEIGRDSPVRFDSSQAVAPFQQGPLAPRSDDSRACGHRQHQKMHIQPSLAKSRPRVFGCVPSAAHISRSVKARRGQAVESICRSGNRPEKQAGSNEQGEAFPLFIFLGEWPMLSRSVFSATLPRSISKTRWLLGRSVSR